MTEWNTNMDEAPRDRNVLVTFRDGTVCPAMIRSCKTAIAWKHLPEPYQEPCPKQRAVWEMLQLGGVHDAARMGRAIELVEKRTLEIVVWHVKHHGMDGLLAYLDGKGPKND